MRAVVVVRDPRGWVNSWLREAHMNGTLGDAVYEAFDTIKNGKCLQENTSLLTSEYHELQEVLLKPGRMNRGR